LPKLGEGIRTNLLFSFLKIARASLLELETQLLIAVLLNYIEAGKEEVMAERLKEESKMINGFIKKLKD